jgi:hemerythrin
VVTGRVVGEVHKTGGVLGLTVQQERAIYMPLIPWDNSLSVSVKEIDQQHQKLVEMINGLHDAMRARKGADTLGPLLKDLIDYAATHFATEETYFTQFGYPEATAHKKAHADFVAEVVDFKSRFDSGVIGMPIEVMSFLSDWLQNHIKGVDKRYGPFFNAHGLK